MLNRSLSECRYHARIIALKFLLSASFILSALVISAQFTQQGPKIVGTEATGSIQQGYAVSISSDGNTAIVGGRHDNGFTGAAWIYIRSGAVWTQQGTKLVGTGAVGNAQQGSSVSISADGNTALVGGPNDNGNAGAAWIFTRSGGVWTQQGSKLVGTGAVGTALQGTSVSISSDGNTAIVGGVDDNGLIGAAWIYTLSGGVWTQQGSKLAGMDAVGGAQQGNAVSISSDGNKAIVGGWLDNGGAGAAWIYIRSGGVWTQQGSKLVGTGAVGAAWQGFSVSISSDGNTAMVGAPADDSFIGAAWIYILSGGVWVQQGSKLVGGGAAGASQQGYGVSLSSNGNTAIVGASLDNAQTGAAWIYTRSGGFWTQQGPKLVGTGAVGGARQGTSVSISSDGNTVIVGGPNDNFNAGAAWIYTLSGGVWTQQGSKLVGTGAIGTARQGYAVSISSDGNTAIVGGFVDNNNVGAAWIFTRSGGVWTQYGSKLVGTGAVGPARQGWSVSISSDGNTAIVGGPGDNSNVGAAWIYILSGGVWTQQGSKLVGTVPAGAAQQGTSVSISADGNTAIVGGPTDNLSTGAAWIYTRSGGVWTQQGSKLVGTGAAGAAQQGNAVSISSDGNTAIVGAPGDNSNAGAAWIYTRSGGVWTQQGSKLVGTGAAGAAQQGYAVSISSDGSTAIVGGPADNSFIGAAWIYTLSGGVWTQQGSKLVGTGATGAARQGYAVSISSDGNTAIVGGRFDNSGIGATWIYTRSGALWTQQGSKLVGTGAVGASQQGWSVSISSDGNTVIVGGPNDNTNVGAAWIFVMIPCTTPAAFNVTGGGDYCATGTPPSIGLDGSSITATYQLYRGTVAVGSTITGTGAAIDFGPQSVPGTYSVLAISGACTATMNGTATVTSTQPANGQFSQQGTKLVGTGNVGAARQGYSVSISSDGNTAIVGGYGDNGNQGAAWVYTRSGGVWTQQGSKLVGADAVGAARQGSSVSISSDGNTAIVGGHLDDGNIGAVWIYTRSGGVWTQQGSKLVGTGYAGLAQQGTSVSISSDGNTAIVGGYNDNGNAGAVWIYTRSGGVWMQQGSKLVGTGAAGIAAQGTSVDLSSDGNTAIVGGFVDNGSEGAAWVFTRSGGVWTQQGSKLVGAGDIGAAQQGSSVSISSDGNTAIVGGHLDDGNLGASWVFTRSGGVWTQQGSKLVGTDNMGSAQQGSSVSISSDGNTALVGGRTDNINEGAAWIYTRLGGVWTQQGSKLVGTGDVGTPHQGHSVSISLDGNTAIVGGYQDNSVQGAAWVFTLTGSCVTDCDTYTITGGGNYCSGNTPPSIGLSGSASTVTYQLYNGATAVGSAITGTGSAIDFGPQAAPGTYTVRAVGATCTSTMAGTATITVTNNTIVIFNVTGGGDYCATGTPPSIGLDGSSITATYQLYRGTVAVGSTVTGTGAAIDFGPQSVPGTYSVLAISGACTATMNGTATVTSTQPTNGQFTQQGPKLVGTGAVGIAQKSYSVSISSDGNTAIVGGDYDNASQGAAWVYTRSGGVWTQQGSKLVGTGNVGAANQGFSVSISSDGNTAIVGGHADNGNIGAAWVYTRLGGVWTQQGSKLVGTGHVSVAQQGISVSISSDGNTAIVGGQLDNGSVGAAWVFTRSGGVWTQQGPKLVSTDFALASRQGSSVSISSDGNTAIVGGVSDNSSAGAAWVYTRSGGVWTQQGSKLVGTGAVGNAQQGSSVSISSDGNTAIVGGYGDNSSAGAAWVYTRSGGVWTQQGSKLVGTGNVGAAFQGRSVSISSDGNTAIVGGDIDNGQVGATWVFTRLGGVWTQQGSKLVGTGNVGASRQGNSVSISSDGNTAIVGGYRDNSNEGAAWVFTLTGSCITDCDTYTITGGGNYCSGNTPPSVGLSGSTSTVTYQLYNGATAVGSAITGTGSAIDFGPQAAPGTYTVRAVGATCSSTMAGTATITLEGQATGNISGSTNDEICAGSGTNVNVNFGSGTATYTVVFNVTRTSGSGASSVVTATAVTPPNPQAIPIPAASLTNPGATQTTYHITWQSLSNASGCTTTSTANLTGSVTITVYPAPDAFATANRPNLCNSSAESITVTNPNGVGGVYDKMVTYGPVTGGTPSATNQPYGTFTETLTNPTGSVQTVTYRFTPKATTGIGCVGQPYTLTIVVQPPPSITCPGNVVTNTDAGQCSANVSGPAVAAGTVTPTGCNGGTTTYTYTIGGATTRTGSGNADGIFNKGVSTVRYTVTDPSGGTSSCTFTVTVNDNQAPVITCATTATGTFFTPTDPGTCSHTSTGGEYTATQTDNCAATLTYQLTGATVAGPTTATTLAGQSFNRGSTLVTWKATDAAGNSSSCTFTVTIYDNQKPVFAGCPGNITVTSAATNANGGGNTNTCNQTVTWTAPTNSDNCPGVVSSTTHAPGSSFGLGTTTVTYTATDAAGNTQTCVFTVTVVDNTPPVITCPGQASYTVTAGGTCSYTITGNGFDATATDNCPGTPTRTYTLSGATTATSGASPSMSNGITSHPRVMILPSGPTLNGVVLNRGATTVTWKATDASGNSSSCSFIINVTDQTKPVVSCFGPYNRNTDAGTCSYTTQGGEFTVTVSDNCSGPDPSRVPVFTSTGSTTITSTPLPGTLSGTVFNKGTTTVLVTVTDQAGNVATCTFTITINDATPPVVTCPGNQTKSADNACEYVAVGNEFDATATDNCSPAADPTITRNYVLSGATFGAGSGTLSGTTFRQGTTTVTWTAVDASFNSSTPCSFTVVVNDNTPPVITCPGNQTRTASVVCNYTTVGSEFDATATDNCPGTFVLPTSPVKAGRMEINIPSLPVVLTYSLTGATSGTGTNTLAGVVFNKGTTTVTWKATDIAGNTSTCSFTVRLIDITPAGDITGATNNAICAGQGTNVVVDLTGVNPFDGVFNITLMPGGPSSTYTWTAATSGFSDVFIPASSLPNSGAANAVYNITWNSLTQSGGCSQTAPSPLLTGSVLITVKPVPDIAASADRPVLCNGSTVAITVTNPNGVGGRYVKQVFYPAGVSHTGVAVAANQIYGTFNDQLTNSNLTPQNVVYTFTPTGPGTSGCVGNAITLTVTVQPSPTITCPGSMTVSTNANVCTANVTSLAPTFGPAGCNGGLTTVTYTITGATTRSGSGDAGGIFEKGVSTVVYTVTDPSGSTAACTFSITVVDTQVPVIVCKTSGNVTTSTSNGACAYIVSGNEFDVQSATDNCIATLTYSLAGATTATVTANTLAGAVFNKGITTVTWKITDASGNSATCKFTVTVSDNEKPVFVTCPGAITVTSNTASSSGGGNTNTCSQNVVLIVPIATDNCNLGANGLNFDGVNDFVSLPNIGLNTNTVTLECWIKPNGLQQAADGIIFSRGGSGTASGLNIAASNATKIGYHWADNQSSNFSGGPIYNINQWNHVALVIEPTRATIYLNGVPTVNNLTHPVVNIGAFMRIGSEVLGGRLFNGSMDEVRIWSYARSQSQIISSMNIELNAQPGLVAAYHFNQGIAGGNNAGITSAADASGNGKSGTLTNFALNGTTSNWVAGTVPGTPTLTNNAPGTFPLGTTNVTWTATDASGNTATCLQTVTVIDDTPPQISCPGSVSKSTNLHACTYRAINTEFDITATDNCTVPPARTYTLSGATTATGAGTLSGTLFNTGTTTVSWLTTDGSGNTSTCSFTVIVTDNQTPVITCNGNRVVPTDPSACTYTHPAGDLTWNASVTENCGVVVLSYTLSGATTNTLGLSSLENQVFNKGVTLVTYTGKDVAGNSATCSFTVTVFDNQAPVINNCGTLSNTVRNTDQGVCTWMAGNTGGRNIDVSITENCAHTVTYTLSGATTMTAMPGTLSNTLFNKGVTTVNVTVADGTFTSTCMYTVTVNDNQLPLITTCPGTQTKSTDLDVCTYRVRNQEFDVVATDNCGLVPTNRTWVVTGAGATPSSGSGTMSNTVFNKGTSFVTWSVTDAVGGTATPCTFTVTVNDNQAPRVVPSIEDQTLNTGGPGCQTTMPDYTGFVRSRAFDNCGTATGTLTITQAAPNQPGTTVIGFGGTRVLVFYLVDAAGNSTTVSFNLLIRDTQKPTALCKPATVFLDANGVATVTVADVDNGSFDNCTQVTMSVSPTTFTCANTNTTNTVVLTVTDANGNIATCTANVTVKDNIKPTVTCPGSITLYKNEIACTTVIPDLAGTATATDNCGVVTRTQSPSAGTIIAASVTQTLVTITAVDASGNTATCTVLVLHKDTIKPFFVTFPGNLTVTSNSVNASGGGNPNTCSQIVNWASPPFGDNCLSVGPVVVVSRTHAPGNSFPVGTTLVVYVIRDAAGNTQTGSFTVTVIDNTKPTITCPGSPFTATTTGSGCTATVSVPTPANADNCGVATVTSDHPSDQYPIGTTVVTWTVTDVNGNTNSCSRQVIVTDRGKPEMTCPASITISPNTSGCVASATIAAPSPVTDCSGPVTITYSITGAGASGTSTGTGAVGSRIFNVGTTNITYTATDAAGNTATCVTSVTVINNLTGSISGTSTVVQNSGTTTAVVFTGTGGTTPYLFTYTITSNGNTNTYTVPTVSSNPSTSVAQSNAVLGVYVYKLIGVTDFYGCSGVITSQNTATVTVVSGPPDFTPTVDIANLSFTTPGQPRDFLVNINEISQLSPSLGAVQFRLVKPTAFTITYSTTSGVSNVFGPQANNNSDWTFTEDAFFITVTLKHPAAQIPANSFSRIGFTITRKVGVAQNTSQNLTVTIVNGSGGDNNNSNNTSNTVVTAQ